MAVRLLVTRPQPGADATTARLRALGHDATAAPLLATEPVSWRLPSPLPGAVMLTSAAAARLGGENLIALLGLPALAVGTATAAAASAAGFVDVRTGAGTVQALLDTASVAGHTGILHLCGADVSHERVPAGLQITRRIVYRARLVSLLALPSADHVLLYSARTARQFAAEIDRLGGRRDAFHLATISPATMAAAGPGWAGGVVASAPDEDALLAVIGLPCQKSGEQRGH